MVRQYLVPAVTRALEVIELLSKQDAGMSISEIHRALRLPLSSAANIVYTLKSLGYLERSEEGSRYRLSLKMLGISRRVLDRMDFLGRCHGLLEELSRESGLTVHLAVMREGESIYIDRVANDGFAAVGKALLAFLPDGELHRALKLMTLPKVTPRTITSRRALETQLASFRRLGYTWEMEEGEMGVACVAAPLYGQQGEVVAAVSATGTIQQIPKNRVATTGAVVKKYAHLMSARLGGGPDSAHA